MQLLFFTRHADNQQPFVREGLSIKHVTFDSNDLEDLLLVAKFRIVNFPTSLIIDNKGKVLLKMYGRVPVSYVNDLCRA